jgi:hypothetical protein
MLFLDVMLHRVCCGSPAGDGGRDIVLCNGGVRPQGAIHTCRVGILPAAVPLTQYS